MTDQQTAALRSMLLCLADDEFILGHRLSEWTGLGPIIEEDIACSSIAQDQLGHALGYYTLHEQLGGGDPDEVAFRRKPQEYRNAQLTELPRGDYGFTMMRQFLYDGAKSERLHALAQGGWEPLRDLTAKILAEARYHWVHNTSMVQRLAGGTEESRIRIQAALNEAFPYALGLFEEYEGMDVLVEAGLAPRESDLKQWWLNKLCPMLQSYDLKVPAVKVGENWKTDVQPMYGGRNGVHTEHLMVILDSIQLLTKADPAATW